MEEDDGHANTFDEEHCLRYSQLAHFISRYIKSGCRKREAHIHWSMVMQRQHPLLELP